MCVVSSTHEQTPTGRRSAAGSKVVVEADVAVDVGVVAAVAVGVDAVGSKVVLEVDVPVDIGVVVAGSKVTVVDLPGMIKQIHERRSKSSKVHPASFGYSLP